MLTLAIRAVLALLLSAATLSAVLCGPAATASAHAPSSRALRTDARNPNSAQPAARRSAIDAQRNDTSRTTAVAFQEN